MPIVIEFHFTMIHKGYCAHKCLPDLANSGNHLNKKLSVKTDCSSVDYILNGYIRRVDSMVTFNAKGFFKRSGVSQRSYSIGVTAALLNHKNKRLIELEVDNGGEILGETLEHIGNEIADNIKMADIPIPPLIAGDK